MFSPFFTNGCWRRSAISCSQCTVSDSTRAIRVGFGRREGSFSRQLDRNSLNSGDHRSGSFSVGGSDLGMRKIALGSCQTSRQNVSHVARSPERMHVRPWRGALRHLDGCNPQRPDVGEPVIIGHLNNLWSHPEGSSDDSVSSERAEPSVSSCHRGVSSLGIGRGVPSGNAEVG